MLAMSLPFNRWAFPNVRQFIKLQESLVHITYTYPALGNAHRLKGNDIANIVGCMILQYL